MPYLHENRRDHLPHRFFDRLPDDPTEADVNYLICLMADEFLWRWGLKYQHLNKLVGAIELAKLEITRRVIGPYEDDARNLNGDVFHSYNLTPSANAE